LRVGGLKGAGGGSGGDATRVAPIRLGTLRNTHQTLNNALPVCGSTSLSLRLLKSVFENEIWQSGAQSHLSRQQCDELPL
jgi:hypothetical protein